MKTRLSLLALPPCWGLALVLIFALAACDDGSKGGSSDGSSSSKSGSSNNPPTGPGEENKEVAFDGFDVGEPDGNKIYLKGLALGTNKDPIVRLEYSGSFPLTCLTDLEGSIPSSGIRTLSSPISSYDFTNVDITLKDNSSCTMECKDHWIRVKACASKCSESAVKNFKKAKNCATSSSGGAQESSSSSEAVWAFESPRSESVNASSTVTIGSGSIKLEGGGETDQPDIVVSGGKIRTTTVTGADFPGDVQANHDYSTKDLGTDQPTSDRLAMQQFQFYLIYFSNGDKYLLVFTKDDDSVWSRWPKKCYYWKATKSP